MAGIGCYTAGLHLTGKPVNSTFLSVSVMFFYTVKCIKISLKQ